MSLRGRHGKQAGFFDLRIGGVSPHDTVSQGNRVVTARLADNRAPGWVQPRHRVATERAMTNEGPSILEDDGPTMMTPCRVPAEQTIIKPDRIIIEGKALEMNGARVIRPVVTKKRTIGNEDKLLERVPVKDSQRSANALSTILQKDAARYLRHAVVNTHSSTETTTRSLCGSMALGYCEAA